MGKVELAILPTIPDNLHYNIRGAVKKNYILSGHVREDGEGGSCPLRKLCFCGGGKNARNWMNFFFYL